MPNTDVYPPLGRRQFMGTILSTSLSGFAAQAEGALEERETVNAQNNLSPDAALRGLMAGNQRFAANQLRSIEYDLAVLREHTVEKQKPFAAVLACADSRVPVELIFDQTIGDIFVTRLAGNIVTPEIVASLEYSVAVLGVKAVVVLGHSSCGAVKAAMKAEAVAGQISTLYLHLRGAVEQSDGILAKAIRSNAQIQADLLCTSSTVFRDAIQAGNLTVKAAVYDLGTGDVTLS